MKKSDPQKLLSHGLHLGHKKQKIHPKSKKYIYTIEKGVSIIDLFQTADLLDKAKEYAFELGKNNKILLFVSTKKVAREEVVQLYKDHKVFYFTNKWVGGFLTNFEEISKNIKKMNKLREDRDTDAWKTLPKHEKNALEKELNKIAASYMGVTEMTTLPDALFIVDIKKERNAFLEARRLNIPFIAVVDTNVDPDDVTYPIPANDDAVSSITYIIKEILEAYSDGKSKIKNESKEKTPDKSEDGDKEKKTVKKD